MRNPFRLLRLRIFPRPHSAALAARRDELSAQIAAIDWPSYETAYGPAVKTAGDLRLLLFGTEEQAMAAASGLWAGLCHQHAYLSSAAEPALPFLLNALRESNDRIKTEILDIFLGFVVCRDPARSFTTRVHTLAAAERPLFEALRDSADKSVRDFAGDICEALDGRPPGSGA